MSTSSDKPGDSQAPTEKSPVILLLSDLGDTTWRMFVPTVGLAFAGFYLDGVWGTKPWLMLTGATLGAVLAGLLIRKQLRKVNQR